MLPCCAMLAFQPARLAPVTMQALANQPVALAPVSMQASEAEPSGELDMSALMRRITEVQSGEAQIRLLDLDAMVPGQKLVFDVPPALVEMLRSEAAEERAIGMVGRQRLQLFSHGVEVLAEVLGEKAGGQFEVSLQAGRRFELLEVGDSEGSRWLGRTARVRWLNNTADGNEAASDEAFAKSAALKPLVDEWIELVRSTGRERSPGQIDGVLDDLGSMPDDPDARALWIAGLINPLPALGVALEIRPAVLMASTTDERLEVVEMGLRDSIKRLQSPGPPF